MAMAIEFDFQLYDVCQFNFNDSFQHDSIGYDF